MTQGSHTSTLRGSLLGVLLGLSGQGHPAVPRTAPTEWAAPGSAVPRGNRDERERSTVLHTETPTPQSRGAAEPREL